MLSFSLLMGIFSATRQTIKLHWQKLIILILFLWVGGRAITYSISQYFTDLPIEFTDSMINIDPEVFAGMSFGEIRTMFQPFILSMLVISLVALLVMMLVQIIVTKLTLTTVEHESLTISELSRFSRHKLSAYIGTSFVQSIYLFGLFLLFIVPGLIYSIYWLFTTTEVIAGNLTYKKAMDESKRLVTGRRWITLLYLLCIILSVSLVQAVLNELFYYIPDILITQAVVTFLSRTFEIVIIILMTHYYLARRKTTLSSHSEIKNEHRKNEHI